MARPDPTPPPGEFDLIARYFRPLAAGREGALGLPDDPADRIARKMLRSNLSDLAAMGAKPLAYFMTCCFPRPLEESWLAGFAAGLAEDQREFGIALMGGDVTATPGPLTLSVTALGTVTPGRELRRSTARAGDLVAVSGSIGDAALGLAVVRGRIPREESLSPLVSRYHLPQPRLALGKRLAGLATACMDVSDGLVGDLGHICEASGLGAAIDAPRVPLSEPARAILAREPRWLKTVLTGGDDYELLFT